MLELPLLAAALATLAAVASLPLLARLAWLPRAAGSLCTAALATLAAVASLPWLARLAWLPRSRRSLRFPCSHASPGQLEPMTVTPEPSRHHLLIFLIVAVVAGGIFLLFWQAVLQVSFGSRAFDESFCIGLFNQLQPGVAPDDFVDATPAGQEVQRLEAFRAGEDGGSYTFFIEKRGEQAESCGILAITSRDLGGAYGDPYSCDTLTFAYRNEETPLYLLAAGRAEWPQEAVEEGLPRFTYNIHYFNHASRAAYEARLRALNNHDCGVI